MTLGYKLGYVTNMLLLTRIFQFGRLYGPCVGVYDEHVHHLWHLHNKLTAVSCILIIL